MGISQMQFICKTILTIGGEDDDALYLCDLFLPACVVCEIMAR
jgi:adenine-specific DNA methylase